MGYGNNSSGMSDPAANFLNGNNKNNYDEEKKKNGHEIIHGFSDN
jgi:hypothetical protein